MSIDHKNNLLSLAIRASVCTAFSAVVYHLWGAVVAVMTIPLFGVLLASPLFDLLGDLRRTVRGTALASVDGRYFAYKGRPIDVDEDAAFYRWVKVKDVESVVGSTLDALPGAPRRPPTAALRQVRGHRYIEADALHALLGACRTEAAGRFRLWLDRTVAYPARRKREQQPFARPEDSRGAR